jgi:hypothetical protein
MLLQPTPHTPTALRALAFDLVSDSELVVRVRLADGSVRSVSLALA